MNIQELLAATVNQGASDLHVKAHAAAVLRVNGRLISLEGCPALSPDDVLAALSAIASAEQLDRFRRNLELDFAHSVPGLARFRVNASFQRGSVGLSFRLVPFSVPRLESLDLPKVCTVLSARSQGLVVVTGPTGSGKSTTLAAMVDYINRHERRRIVTIEDPIEFLHGDNLAFITQREVGGDTRDFASALRAALRQDPDVILLGEMRDLETIAAAITAAETGHLVLGTLHTVGAAQTIDRIINVFPPMQQQEVRMELSLCLEGVISQTLMPRASAKGRIAAAEVMLASPAVRNLIREGKTYQLPNVLASGAQLGMQTLDQHLFELVAARHVTLDEAMLRATDPDELSRRLRADRSAGFFVDSVPDLINRPRR